MEPDIERQIVLWRDDAIEDIATAELIHKHGRHSFALFTVHLAVEKLLKVHVMLTTGQRAPYIHNLPRLKDSQA
jgi:HEPN domain-containing protein